MGAAWRPSAEHCTPPSTPRSPAEPRTKPDPGAQCALSWLAPLRHYTCKRLGVPGPVSIQNDFSLLARAPTLRLGWRFASSLRLSSPPASLQPGSSVAQGLASVGTVRTEPAPCESNRHRANRHGAAVEAYQGLLRPGLGFRAVASSLHICIPCASVDGGPTTETTILSYSPSCAYPGPPQDRRFESELAEACSDANCNLGLMGARSPAALQSAQTARVPLPARLCALWDSGAGTRCAAHEADCRLPPAIRRVRVPPRRRSRAP